MIDRKLAFGAAVALGGVLLIPGVAVALGRAARPLVKAAVRTGTTAYDEFRRAGAEAYETFEDVLAEVRSEADRAAEGAADAAGDVREEVERAVKGARKKSTSKKSTK